MTNSSFLVFVFSISPVIQPPCECTPFPLLMFPFQSPLRLRPPPRSRPCGPRASPILGAAQLVQGGAQLLVVTGQAFGLGAYRTLRRVQPCLQFSGAPVHCRQMCVRLADLGPSELELVRSVFSDPGWSVFPSRNRLGMHALFLYASPETSVCAHSPCSCPWSSIKLHACCRPVRKGRCARPRNLARATGLCPCAQEAGGVFCAGLGVGSHGADASSPVLGHPRGH